MTAPYPQGNVGQEPLTVEELTPPTQPGVFGFGIAEIVYLTEIGGTQASERSKSSLALDGALLDDNTRSYAISSLMARGFLEVADGMIRPVRAAAILAFIFANAERWITCMLMGSEGSDSAILIHGAGLTAFLQRRALGVFYVSIVEQGVSDVETLWGIIDAQLEQSPGSTIGMIIIRADAPDPRVMFVRPHVEVEGGGPVEGLFDVAIGKGTDDKPDLVEGGPHGEDQVDAMLSELVGPDSDFESQLDEVMERMAQEAGLDASSIDR